MDAGEVIVEVIVNSPIDLDTDLTNQGLVYPQMGINNQYQSLFSEQYMINTIENQFESGKFTQVLHLVRYINGDAAKSAAGALGNTRSDNSLTPAGEVQQNQEKLTQTSATSAGQDTPSGQLPAVQDDPTRE
jgi:hypothetical protein